MQSHSPIHAKLAWSLDLCSVTNSVCLPSSWGKICVVLVEGEKWVNRTKEVIFLVKTMRYFTRMKGMTIRMARTDYVQESFQPCIKVEVLGIEMTDVAIISVSISL